MNASLHSLKPDAPRVRVLCGATGCGKSVVALKLAEQLGAEILSIDSMKIYKALDLGTAKPRPEVRLKYRHHLIDIREPWQGFSVAEFLQLAQGVIEDCARRGVALIAEGGTALYLKALAEGLFAGPGRDLGVRQGLEQEGLALGTEALHARLAQLDPLAAARILPGDLRRIVRALEVFTLTGKPISAWQAQWGKARCDLDVRLVCLRLPREVLYRRIDQRVGQMLAAGWLEECRGLVSLSQPLSREAAQALGYRTLMAHLRGELSLEEARQRICFDTHHFARRQLNWFKHLPKLSMLDISENEDVELIAERVAQAWLQPLN